MTELIAQSLEIQTWMWRVPARITKITAKPPIEVTKKGMFLGYDPGTRNSGIAVIDNCTFRWPVIFLFQVELERSDDAITRTIGMKKLISHCVNWFCYPQFACIEGASFGDRYRQVELAEVRAAAVIWCYDHEFETKVVPPLVVRKEVFGNGRTKANEVWTNIPADAANALACAYWSVLCQ